MNSSEIVIMSRDRVLTTHTGSLPRRDALMTLIEDEVQGKPVEGELDALLPGEVLAIVGQQQEAGIDLVSDGEAGKAGYNSYVLTRLEGLGGETEQFQFNDVWDIPEMRELVLAELAELRKRFKAGGALPGCVGDLRYIGQQRLQRDIVNLQAAMAEHGIEEAFMPAVSPGTLATQAQNFHYPSYEAYLEALADAMRQEYTAIVGAGLILQLDCPDIPLTAPGHRKYWANDVVERLGHRRLVELHVDALNRATEALPVDRLRLHLCWGNYEGPHHYDAPLRDVLEPVLRRARVSAVSFESANPRHGHEWETFAELDVPEEMSLIPGVIDSTTNFVEHPRLVSQRIERFAEFVGRDRVMAGTDCGFASSVGMRRVHPTIVWMKLRSLSQGAAIASDHLW